MITGEYRPVEQKPKLQVSSSKDLPKTFHCGPRPKGRAREVGFLGRGQQPPPHQLWGLGSVVSSPSGVRAEARPPKGFPLFSALRMASPDTIILDCLLGLYWTRLTLLNGFSFLVIFSFFFFWVVQ